MGDGDGRDVGSPIPVHQRGPHGPASDEDLEPFVAVLALPDHVLGGDHDPTQIRCHIRPLGWPHPRFCRGVHDPAGTSGLLAIDRDRPLLRVDEQRLQIRWRVEQRCVVRAPCSSGDSDRSLRGGLGCRGVGCP